MAKYQNYLDSLKRKLEKNFDLTENVSLLNRNYDLFARLNVKNEKFVLLPEVKLYGFENNEYFYIRRWENPDTDSLKAELNDLKRELPSLIERQEDHMSSALHLILVIDGNIPADAEKLVRKYFYQKGFAFGFKGWADLSPVIVSLSEERVIAHNKIKKTAAYFKPEDAAARKENL
jgi:hypothetical protein